MQRSQHGSSLSADPMDQMRPSNSAICNDLSRDGVEVVATKRPHGGATLRAEGAPSHVTAPGKDGHEGHQHAG